MGVQSDWKTPARVRDPEAMKRRHLRGGPCELWLEDDRPCEVDRSIHHLLKRGQGGDDVEANFVFLCGSGVTGHHGLVEAEEHAAMEALGRRVWRDRPDTVEYLRGKLVHETAENWLARRLFV